MSARRTSHTLPCARHHDATAAPFSRRQTNTMPAVLRPGPPPSDDTQRRPPPDRQDSDDSTTSPRDAVWLESTHFGAEIRQIEPPTESTEQHAGVTGVCPTGSWSNDHIHVDTATVSTEDSPSRQTEHSEGEEDGNPWLLRQEACSRRITGCDQPNKTTIKTLRRCHSFDSSPTSMNDWTTSLPVNLTATGRLQLLDNEDHVPSGDNHPLNVVTRGGGSADANNSTSLCLARKILHELEEDLIESPEPLPTDSVPDTDCGSQQTTAADCTLQQPSSWSDDVTVSHESSSSSTCSNDFVSPTISDCDSKECEVTHGSNTTETTGEDTAEGLTLPDSAAAASTLREPNSEPEAPSGTIVTTLKSVFSYFMAKLGGHGHSDVQSEPELGIQRPASDEGDSSKKHVDVPAVCQYRI